MLSLYIDYPKFITPYVIPGSTLVRWYGVMYLLAFLTSGLLLRYLTNHKQDRVCFNQYQGEDADFIVWIAISLVLGARVGSCLLYSGSYYWTHPHLIFWPFNNGKFVGLPGMSYHGGVIGAIIGIFIYSKKNNKYFWDLMDDIGIIVPFGYTWGRFGNFFNAELYGKVTTSSIGMLFPDAEPFSTTSWWVKNVCSKVGISTYSQVVNLPRHPSQLYEAFFEGLVLGLFMWFVVRPKLKNIRSGTAAGIYLIGYGFVRFIIEYFRQPDENIGFVFSPSKEENIYLFKSVFNISMGQVLCFVMMITGLIIILYRYDYHKKIYSLYLNNIKSKIDKIILGK